MDVRALTCCLNGIVYNAKKTVCSLVRPTQSQRQDVTDVRVGHGELHVTKFQYLGRILNTSGCDDKDVE